MTADLHATIARLTAEVETLRAEKAAVLELHRPLPNSRSALYPEPQCACGADWPCETARALGVES